MLAHQQPDAGRLRLQVVALRRLRPPQGLPELQARARVEHFILG